MSDENGGPQVPTSSDKALEPNLREGLQLPNKSANLLELIQSPMRLLGLSALICSSVFAICATQFHERQLFIYCIHMFVAVVGAMLLTAACCPASLYNPNDIKGLADKLPPHRPVMAIVTGLIGMGMYMTYCLVSRIVYSYFPLPSP